MAEPSDRALVENTLRGDLEAYGELVRRYQQSVYNVCLRLMGDRQSAEDQTQDAFLRAHRRLETYDLARPFGPWIRTVAANLCLNELRRAGPVQLPLEEHDLPLRTSWTDPEGRLQQSEMAAAVRAALLELPPHYRAVIELRHYGELSYQEIAAGLGISVSSVRSHLYRARGRLAEILEDLDE